MDTEPPAWFPLSTKTALLVTRTRSLGSVSVTVISAVRSVSLGLFYLVAEVVVLAVLLTCGERSGSGRLPKEFTEQVNLLSWAREIAARVPLMRTI